MAVDEHLLQDGSQRFSFEYGEGEKVSGQCVATITSSAGNLVILRDGSSFSFVPYTELISGGSVVDTDSDADDTPAPSPTPAGFPPPATAQGTDAPPSTAPTPAPDAPVPPNPQGA